VHVLLVDDEWVVRESLGAVLEQRGAMVTLAGSTAEALAALEDSSPDVIVSDIAMPEADGYELIRKIRAAEAAGGQRIPAVALTAYAGMEDRVRALAAGYQLHVPKPVDPDWLVMVIADLTEQPGNG
jgi:CheY-like chemotaxis protein